MAHKWANCKQENRETGRQAYQHTTGAAPPSQHSPRCPCARRQRGQTRGRPRRAPPPAALPTGLHPRGRGGALDACNSNSGSRGGVERRAGRCSHVCTRRRQARRGQSEAPSRPACNVNSSRRTAQYCSPPTWILLLQVLPKLFGQAGRQRCAHKATSACRMQSGARTGAFSSLVKSRACFPQGCCLCCPGPTETHQKCRSAQWPAPPRRPPPAAGAPAGSKSGQGCPHRRCRFCCCRHRRRRTSPADDPNWKRLGKLSFLFFISFLCV